MVKGFNPYSDHVGVTTMTDTAAKYKDLKTPPDVSQIPTDYGQVGYIVATFSVAQFLKDGESALAVGTYTLPQYVPKNCVVSAAPIAYHTEAKAGSGTITPSVGATAMTAVSTVQTLNETSKLALGTAFAADTAITVAVASNTVTAGAFTLIIPLTFKPSA